MRVLLALIVIIYIVGIGVVLAPTIQSKWNNATASDFTASVAGALPVAMGWPERAYHRVSERD